MANLRFDWNQVERDLSKLSPKERERVVRKIEDVFRPAKPSLNNARRLRDSESYRLRIGEYRVFYQVEQGFYVIMAIRFRKDAYKKK